jgi:hypothetical protein
VNNKKGILFTFDGLLALIFIAILIGVFSTNLTANNIKQLEKIQINQKISDLLITSQYLEIDDLYTLEKNYKKLFNKQPGYIKINNKIKNINASIKNQLITQSITYINSSNKEIYIEIGVYY